MKHPVDKYAELYDEWAVANPAVLESEVRLLAKVLADGGRILSVGCRSGLFEQILRDDYGIDIAYCVEASEPLADIARRRGLNVEIATPDDYDYPAEHFDTILLNGFPSYVDDLDKVCRKLYGALAPGGKAILADITGDIPGLADDDARVRRRTTEEKVEALRKAGFHDLAYEQTLTRPVGPDSPAEEPSEGYLQGDYVAVTAYRR